ncbi:LysR family transcriptional regulator [Pseudoruegeria sp. SK021]|uniref:LysR family transcriptional regulator n=1 Tax=Pseudoruegeria sp. SK021 TaxID=1933035 RepID=UPI000A2238FB|nr:LysR family transcriptional regulator [Pseudoruegeria sp. SK021]OSP56170.1 hypothetical protein BV911_04365 [Pseudoruegeria sp. SK021]
MPPLKPTVPPALHSDQLIRRGLRLPQLRLMVAVQDLGQISAAAAQLSMTQPAASRLLAELEQTLDQPLYKRHSRGIALTEAGALLATRARKILGALDQTEAEVAQIKTGARGRVRIGTVTGPGLEIVLPVIRQLQDTHPEIELSVEVDTSDKLGEALIAQELEFYLGRVLDNIDPRSVTLRPIRPEPLCLIVRNGHPLQRRTPLALSECLAFDWVMQAPGSVLRRTIDGYLLEQGLPLPAKVLSTSSLLLTMALIGDTDAVAPVSRSVAAFYAGQSGPDGPGGPIHILDVAQDMQVSHFSLITRKGDAVSPAARRVITLIAAQAGLA